MANKDAADARALLLRVEPSINRFCYVPFLKPLAFKVVNFSRGPQTGILEPSPASGASPVYKTTFWIQPEPWSVVHRQQIIHVNHIRHVTIFS